MACCDLGCGDEVKGGLPRELMVLCTLPSSLIWSQHFCHKLGTSNRFELSKGCTAAFSFIGA